MSNGPAEILLVEDNPNDVELALLAFRRNNLFHLDERTRNLPVVMLTSSSEDRAIHDYYCLGANSYRVKPIEFEKFVEVTGILSMYWLHYNQPPLM